MKLLIADDEIRIRKGLYNLIHDNIDIELLEPAKNGEMAYDMIKKHHPEIILIDICMPKMNGLNLISKVKSIIPDSIIIIISGHDEFSYATEAIDLGVDKYLLKPVNSLELIDLIKYYMKHILEQNAVTTNHQWIHETLETHKDVVIDHFFTDWCQQKITSNDVIKKLKHLKIELKQKVVLKYISKVILLRGNSLDKEIIIQQLIDEYTRNNILCLHFNKSYLLINHSNEILVNQIQIEFLCKIKKTYNSLLLVDSLSITDPVTKLPEKYNIISQSQIQSQLISDIVLDAIQIINSNYFDATLTLKEIAKNINVSHEYLSRLFKKETMLSPKEYMINTRLNQALKLLNSDESMRINEIAYKTGFSSQHYFCRIFKKKYGLAPTEYMKGQS